MAKKKTAERTLMTQIILLQPKPEMSNEDLTLLFKGAQDLQKHIPCLIAVCTGEKQSTFIAATPMASCSTLKMKCICVIS